MPVLADMTTPDGRTLTVRGASEKDVKTKARRLAQEFEAFPEVDQPAGLTVGEFGARRLLNNALNLPGATGDALALGGAALQTVSQSLGDTEQDFLDRLRANFEAQRQQAPASGFRAVQEQLPENFASIQAAGQTVGDVATGQASPGQFGEQFAQNKLELARREEALRQQQPIATGAGDIAGDAATIFTGRLPRTRARQQAARETRLSEEASERAAMQGLSESGKQKISDVLTGKILPALGRGTQTAGRGAKKAGEAGIEGTTLALLNDGDPISTGMWAAGAQGAASLPLFALDEFSRAPFKSLGVGTLAFSLFQLYGPETTQVIESTEDAVRKAGAGLALGALSGLAGAGRVRGSVMENYPRFADALTSAPRGAVLSTIEDLNNAQNEGETAPLGVMEKFVTDPAFFNENQQKALGRALTSEKTGAFRQEVDRLMKNNKKFREKIEALQ